MVTDGYAEFLKLKRHYVSVAKTVRRDAESSIKESDFGDAWHLAKDSELSDGAWRWGKRFAHQWIDPIVEDALRTFRKRKCYEIDFDRFWDYYLNTSQIEDCLYKWTIQGGVISQIENEEDCRELLRQERVERAKSAWIGGTLGGGMKGAVKGAAKAEILNYAGAAVVGIFNKIGRRRTIQGAVEQMVQAFYFFQLELLDAVYKTVIGFAEAVAEVFDCLMDSGVEYETTWDGGDKRRIEAMFSNLRSGNVPEEDQKMVALKIVKSIPHDDNIYAWMYDHFPNERKSIDELASFFCVEIDKNKSKAKADEHRRKLKKSNDLRKRKLAEEAKRTVFGIVYPSLKDAKFAAHDFNEFLRGVKEVFKRLFSGEHDCVVREQMEESFITRLRDLIGVGKEEKVICFFDTTMWSSAKYGLCVTSFGLRWRNKDDDLSRITKLSWPEFASGDYAIKKDGNGNILLAKSSRWDVDYAGMRIDKFVDFLRLIRQYYQEGSF